MQHKQNTINYNGKKLTIIIPVYNAEECIKKCLESIIVQIDYRVELILVNDGSNDNSGHICEEFSRKNFNIKVIHQDNSGSSVARNIGIENSVGEWIMFVDADDFLNENFYEIISCYLDVDAELLIFDAILNDTKSTSRKQNNDILINYLIYGKNRNTLLEKCFLGCGLIEGHYTNIRSIWGKLFRRDLIIKNSIHFDKSVEIGEDMLFMLNIYSSLNLAQYIPQIIYHYNFNNNVSITNRFKPDYNSLVDSFVIAINSWLDKHNEYISYHENYRLNDIILFLKYDFFHERNKESFCHKKNRMKEIFADKYPTYYYRSKKNKLIQTYPISKRVVFFLAIHNSYHFLKFVCFIKYRQRNR